jgi:hypothetical protein
MMLTVSKPSKKKHRSRFAQLSATEFDRIVASDAAIADSFE